MTVTILTGDARGRLQELQSDSVHCVVTSPPYYGLRDYGVAGQIGLEASPDDYIDALVEVFREVRRVLRPDGTLWLNIGDSYAADGGTYRRNNGNKDSRARYDGRSPARPRHTGSSIKPKDLIGIPWMLAFALRADGWWLRQEIIWSKPNPMPERVRDRCTKAHESLFLLSKRARYWFDAAAIEEERVSDEDANGFRGGAYVDAEIDNGVIGKRRTVGNKRLYVPGNKTHRGALAYEAGDEHSRTKAGLVAFAERERGKAANGEQLGTRNRRSVWTVARSEPFAEAHFATYPPTLVEPCLLAGCPEGGTVLDPFAGSGTTGLAADRIGRNAILIELNPEYADMARRRLIADARLFADVA